MQNIYGYIKNVYDGKLKCFIVLNRYTCFCTMIVLNIELDQNDLITKCAC